MKTVNKVNVEDTHLLLCHAMLFGQQFPTFRRTNMPSHPQSNSPMTVVFGLSVCLTLNVKALRAFQMSELLVLVLV